MFYSKLFEEITSDSEESKDIIPVNVKFLNRKIRQKLTDKYTDKYDIDPRPGSVKTKKIGKISVEELAADISNIIDEYAPEWKIKDEKIELIKPNTGLSGKYNTIFFDLEHQNGAIVHERFVLRGDKIASEASTPTILKECLVCYFYNTNKKYEPFEISSKLDNIEQLKVYDELLHNIISEISPNGLPEAAKINGCLKKDVIQILDFLKFKTGLFDKAFAISIFNAMSIGNYLKQSIFKKANWEIKRDEVFSNIKTNIGRGIYKYSALDKWNPSDIMLIKPNSSDAIIEKINEISADTNNITRDENIQKLFVDNLNEFDNSYNSEITDHSILGISLKESIARFGKAKGYLLVLDEDYEEKFTYNLTAEEKKLAIGEETKITDHNREQINDAREIVKLKIIEARKTIEDLINDIPDIEYIIQNGGIEDYNNTRLINKYASLKLVIYILKSARKNINVFANLINFGLSLVQNPAFFKFIGSNDGDPKKVADNIKIFKPNSGIVLYTEPINNYNGKIQIIDSNNAIGLKIKYNINYENIISGVELDVRTINADPTVQASLEIGTMTLIKDNNINETFEYFYPNLF